MHTFISYKLNQVKSMTHHYSFLRFACQMINIFQLSSTDPQRMSQCCLTNTSGLMRCLLRSNCFSIKFQASITPLVLSSLISLHNYLKSDHNMKRKKKTLITNTSSIWNKILCIVTFCLSSIERCSAAVQLLYLLGSPINESAV